MKAETLLKELIGCNMIMTVKAKKNAGFLIFLF